jgi:CRP-like cAMP-binding protein
MQIDDAASVLASAEFFGICTDDERRLLAFASERKRYQAGAVISAAGEVPTGAHVLILGKVSIKAEGPASAPPHIVTQHGAVIGVSALMIERPRPVTMVAVEFTETLLVPRNAFRKLLNASPVLASRAAERTRRELIEFMSALAPLRKKIRE